MGGSGGGLDDNHTQARTLEDVREMARDLVALVLEIDEADVGQIEVPENGLVLTSIHWNSELTRHRRRDQCLPSLG